MVPYDEEGYGYNDVWILSIPSFTWTMVLNAHVTVSAKAANTTEQAFNSTENIHHSFSCDVVNDGQMIVMGGWFPDSSHNDCDAPDIWGQHNLNLGANNVLGVHWYQYRESNSLLYNMKADSS